MASPPSLAPLAYNACHIPSQAISKQLSNET